MRAGASKTRRGRRTAALLILAGLASTPARPDELAEIQALAERGRAELALRRLEDLLVRQPGQPEGHLLRGVLLSELGRNEDAQRTFQELSRRWPERPEPRHNLAVLQAVSGRPASAMVALEEIVERYPGYDTAAANLERIRGGVASGGFDPLSPSAPRVALVLTAKLRSWEPAATRPQSASTSPRLAAETPVPPVPAVDAPPAATAPEIVPAPEPEAAAAAPGPEAAVGVAQPESVVAAPVPRVAEPEAPPATGPAAQPQPRVSTLQPEAARSREPGVPGLGGEIERLVVAWATAWSQQRIREYLGFYAADFQPDDHPSREAWEATRRRRLATPSFIEVGVDLETMTWRQAGPDEASVTFTQHYRSDRFGDTVAKTLDLIRESGGWRIRRETSR